MSAGGRRENGVRGSMGDHRVFVALANAKRNIDDRRRLSEDPGVNPRDRAIAAIEADAMAGQLDQIRNDVRALREAS